MDVERDLLNAPFEELGPPMGWQSAGEHEHFVQFYDSDGFLLDAVSGYVEKGLRLGDGCLTIATAEHRTAIDSILSSRGIDIARVVASGHYVSLDATETLSKFMVGGTPDANRFEAVITPRLQQLASGERRVRAFGEMVALLWRAGQHSAAARLEDLGHDLGRKQPFSLLCAYKMNGFDCASDATKFREICLQHSRVLPSESYSGLGTNAERLREIAVLQQKARSLEAEIEGRKAAEEAAAAYIEKLRDSERKFRLLANTIPQLAWMARPDGWVFWYNEQWYKYTGTTPNEMDGWGWQTVHDPDQLPKVLQRWKHSLGSGEPFDLVFPLRGADGQFRPFLTRVQPLRDSGGEIILWFGTNTDISEQQRQEQLAKDSAQRLRGVLETTPDCVKIVASDGRLLYMNPQGLSMVQARDLSEVEGASIFNLIAPEHRKAWKGFHQRVCSGEKLSCEFEIVGLKGKRLWMETRAVPLPLSNGQFAQLAVTREVTERKRAEAERQLLLERERAARAEAERASRIKDEFLTTLSHELRTPLNAILGWSELLRSQPLDPAAVSQGLEIIERNARAQAQMIADLLEMTRIVAGKVQLDLQQVNLSSVLEEVIETIRPAAAAKEISISLKTLPFAGPVIGDSNRMQQVFWNLFSNAIKFTPRAGQVKVLVEQSDSQVEVNVTDTGEGIAPEFLPHVFDRFRQADSSTTRRHGGLGLGLSIVKQLVELHGGSVRADSPGLGSGASFAVAFPIATILSGPQRCRSGSPSVDVTGSLPPNGH